MRERSRESVREGLGNVSERSFEMGDGEGNVREGRPSGPTWSPHFTGSRGKRCCVNAA